MKIKKITKRYVTLIEMMIVMALIAMLAGVLAYNVRGSLEKGKAFATEQSMEKISQALLLHLAEYPEDIDQIESEWQVIVSQSPNVGNPDKVIRDGWGKLFRVYVDTDTPEGDAKIMVVSDAYNKYKRKK